jgi:hypothetical protein
MLDCLLAFLSLCVVLVPDRFGDDEGGEEGPGSIAEEASSPPPPPPPPAAKAGLSEDAVFIATRNVANVPSLITSLIIRASCLRVRSLQLQVLTPHRSIHSPEGFLFRQNFELERH